LNEVLKKLGDDEKRDIFAAFVNEGDITKAQMYAEREGVKMDEIFEAKSVEVTSLVFQM